MRILTVIPAKGHSRRVPNKNLSSLNGKPLILYTIEAFSLIESVDLVVSTDSKEIANIASSKNVTLIDRDQSLCLPHVHSSAVVMDALKRTSGEYDYISVALPTLPFRESDTLKQMISFFMDRELSSLISIADVCKGFSHLVRATSKPHDYKRLSKKTNFQDDLKDQLYSISGFFQIAKMSHFTRHLSFHPHAKFFPISFLEGFDINTQDELIIANAIASYYHNLNRKFNVTYTT